ncbi:MAG: hypothetical protein ACKV2V_15920 [Blastocatellia bacterium]
MGQNADSGASGGFSFFFMKKSSLSFGFFSKSSQTTINCGVSRDDYLVAYEVPEAYRTTNAVDRLMNQQDRCLYAMGDLHGSDEKAELTVRAMALYWNFHHYSQRVRREDSSRTSPCADLNGISYHPNWLHNLLIAASLRGHRT